MHRAASTFGVYIHFPYCLSKCPYCDFASVVAERIPHARYAACIAAELEMRARLHRRRPVESIYFGGGTPSLWEARHVGETLAVIDRLFGIASGCEITLEANPGASEAARFRALAALGVNRLSIGVQSFHEGVLAGLGRRHSAAEARRAVELAREAGFVNLSLDLIFGGPGQTVEGAEADVAQAIRLAPEHLSCYGLTLEGLAEEVRLAKDVKRGKVVVPDDEAQAEMGARVRAALEAAGYRRYEISNYARPGYESRHNTLYWEGGEYVAAGCGAHGFLRQADGSGLRYGNPRKPEAWMRAVESGASPEVERDVISPQELFEERLFLGLRLSSGLDLDAAARETVGEVPAETLQVVDELLRQGLLWREGARVGCTERGFDFHTEIAVRLLPDSRAGKAPAPSKKDTRLPILSS